MIAEAQKAGGTCAFVDAEHASDPVYAEKLGVVIDDLVVSKPDTGEQALEVTDMPLDLEHDVLCRLCCSINSQN